MKTRSRASRFCNPVNAAVESLEGRRLLSTINWTNRGVTSGANDDRFDDVFGSSAETARQVIDGAIDYWERSITDFNYGNGTNTFNLTVTMNTGSASFAANGGFNQTVSGKPSARWLSIARGNVDGDPNSSNGWFLDTTPLDSSEFRGNIVNAYVGNPGTAVGTDMLTPALHELGHAMGLVSNTTMNALSTNTGQADAQGAGANFWRFDGPNVRTLMTAYDSGGAGGSGSNANGAQHFAPAGAQFSVNGNTYFGAVDLMNAFYTTRAIPSWNDVMMLHDAYGYSVQDVEALGTFYNMLLSD